MSNCVHEENFVETQEHGLTICLHMEKFAETYGLSICHATCAYEENFMETQKHMDCPFATCVHEENFEETQKHMELPFTASMRRTSWRPRSTWTDHLLSAFT